ncbi:putative Myo-inositol-monophosphatase [Seiridium unicorne]|uniref:Myo-inositol-monophosphatase n=1 Tax=Seiridium unicorne TaxID=138068 RepID=A0ABR2VA58_9PEZI
MDSPYAKEFQTAINVIQQAAKLSQSVISAEDKGVIEKDDLSPVTVADFAIQALLTASIHHVFPDDKFVGEESAADLRESPALLDRVWALLQRLKQAEAQSLCKLPSSPEQMCEMIDWCGLGKPGGVESGRVWIFDPIDGTQTFVKGQAYAINVALLEGGKQLLSIVGCPTIPVDAKVPITDDTKDPTGRGLVVFAAKGYGTHVRPLADSAGQVQTRKIEPHAETATLADLRSVTCFNTLVSGIDDAHQTIVERLGVAFPGCDLLGWVPRWVTLALGAANMTVWVYRRRDRFAKIWDHAGAMLLFEEVGGKITDVDGKDIDLTVGRKLTSNYGFIAAPKNLHATVLQTVHDVLKEQGKDNLLAST